MVPFILQRRVTTWVTTTCEPCICLIFDFQNITAIGQESKTYCCHYKSWTFCNHFFLSFAQHTATDVGTDDKTSYSCVTCYRLLVWFNSTGSLLDFRSIKFLRTWLTSHHMSDAHSHDFCVCDFFKPFANVKNPIKNHLMTQSQSFLCQFFGKRLYSKTHLLA